MASFTLKAADVFPVTTTVYAFLQSDWPPQVPPSGAPPGVAATSAVVQPGGEIALAGLADNTRYYAAAQVAGVWRYIGFWVTPLPRPSQSATEAEYQATRPGISTLVGLPTPGPENKGLIWFVSDDNGGTQYQSNGVGWIKQAPSLNEGGASEAVGGDAGGTVGAITVERIRGKTTPAAGAGDDGKVWKYDHASGAYVFVDVATQAELDAHAAATGLGLHIPGSGVTVGQLAFDPATQAELNAHTGNTANPHAVTKAQVGLGSADNTSDANKPVSTAAQAALNAKADLVSGRVPATEASLSRRRPKDLAPGGYAWMRAATCVGLGTAGTWDSRYVGLGTEVVYDPDEGKLALLYGGADDAANYHQQTGLAYSDDGVAWTKYASNPVLPNGASGAQDYGSAGFLQLIRKDGTWHGWYIGISTLAGETSAGKIMYATASTLKGPWTKQGVVVSPSDFPQSPETVTYVYRPRVIEVGGVWYMFTNTSNTPGTDEDIWYLTAAGPEGPWTPVAKVYDNTTFGGILSDPDVFRWGDEFFMVIGSHGAHVPASGAGLYVFHCDLSEFPATWHLVPNGPVQSGSPAIANSDLWRQTFVILPSGQPALFVQDNGYTNVSVYVPRAGAEAAPIATARHGSSVAITTATVTTPDLNTVVRDPGGWCSRPSSRGRITFPVSGRVTVGGSIAWANNATGERYLGLRLNGVNATDLGCLISDRRGASPSNNTEQSVETSLYVIAGDYIELVVYQSSGGNLNLRAVARGTAGEGGASPYLWAMYHGP